MFTCTFAHLADQSFRQDPIEQLRIKIKDKINKIDKCDTLMQTESFRVCQ